MCSIHQLLKHHVPIKKIMRWRNTVIFLAFMYFFSLFRFEERKEIGQKCYVMAWLMGILLTRQEPIIFFLINTQPHHQHHSYRQHDHDLRLQKMVNTVGVLVMSWRNGISSCPFCRYWKKFSRKKQYKSSFLPLFHNKYFLFFRVLCACDILYADAAVCSAHHAAQYIQTLIAT